MFAERRSFGHVRLRAEWLRRLATERVWSRAGLLCLSAADILKCRIIAAVADFLVVIRQVREVVQCKDLKVAD